MRLVALAVVTWFAAPAYADPCAAIATAPVTVATAGAADEYTLAVEVASESATSWKDKGNEALVLAVTGKQRGLIGHLIVHQGTAKFTYTMHLGALAAGETIALEVSPLSAAKATRKATACSAQLVPVAGPLAEAIANAPIYRWPAQKAFDDVPMLVGWSKAEHSFQTVMTNENGGTAEICGGGAAGMQAEISRWGRSLDIEDHYRYGAVPSFERCTGRATAKQVTLHMEGAHPNLYLGNGHNRLFESRAGYGAACGAKLPEAPDGEFPGWGAKASTALADDAGKVIVLRPVPVDLDALDYPKFGGRREALADHYAPWLYRLSALELTREGKLDGERTFGMERYLYVDIQVADVGGEGGTYCAKSVHGGFKLRAVDAHGKAYESAQLTAKYAFGGHHDWKRVAIPLPKGVAAADIDHFTFDAYDADGIYVTGIGDAFIPKAAGDNGATLEYVRRGVTPLTAYVDDNRATCTHGTIVGPATVGGATFTCAGGELSIAK